MMLTPPSGADLGPAADARLRAEQDRGAPPGQAAHGPVPRACCYTVDEGYLLPTLLSASQVRRTLPDAVAV